MDDSDNQFDPEYNDRGKTYQPTFFETCPEAFESPEKYKLEETDDILDWGSIPGFLEVDLEEDRNSQPSGLKSPDASFPKKDNNGSSGNNGFSFFATGITEKEIIDAANGEEIREEARYKLHNYKIILN